MIGLDTNVLVRYLAKDDPQQTAHAVKLMRSLSENEPGFVSLVVIAELNWVLETCYRFDKLELVDVLDTLLASKEVILERPEIVSQAVRQFASGGADLADYLIERGGHSAGCSHTFTFDQKAAASAGMRLL
ncbi:MAG TPA: type II toxin-antitoxin system VapC family toxin, partial [Terriglobales bacterium]|nr:type II toxin-antitoxin system VapC family toxin [Terriglobales bacterium]